MQGGVYLPPPLLPNLIPHPTRKALGRDAQRGRGRTEKMKATFKGRYEANKNATAVATLAVNAGDVRVKASMADSTFIRGPSLNGLAFSVEKPGAFILDYNLPTNVCLFFLLLLLLPSSID
ncbi:hypothetical protein ZIOFF_002567 [Zingiber officinale]|uniref:Uncharacterized protein n=1 Tax=Zingiber officinale TaxID=94328 RepID=A0A8J5IQW2_ZINOF|nr:hypothetical protein ZIOFF_002567 [Zingiber officinale]